MLSCGLLAANHIVQDVAAVVLDRSSRPQVFEIAGTHRHTDCLLKLIVFPPYRSTLRCAVQELALRQQTPEATVQESVAKLTDVLREELIALLSVQAATSPPKHTYTLVCWYLAAALFFSTGC